MRRYLIWIGLVVAGLAAGYLAVRVGGAEAPGPEPAPVAVETSASSSPPPPLRGSSFSVVGGMTREELIRNGLLVPPQGDAADSMSAGPPAAGQYPGAGEMEGPPAALAFPQQVQQAARRYLCLCGCAHTLDQCPCNDQPIGAATMLSHLQRLLDGGKQGGELDGGMVDRYGPQVMAPDGAGAP